MTTELFTKQVYSLRYPQVHSFLSEVYKDPEMLDRHLDSYTNKQEGCEYAFKEAYEAWVSPLIEGLAEFDNFYPCGGSSEAIREVIGSQTTIHVFTGDYEGFAGVAEDSDVQVVYHDRDTYPKTLKKARSGDLFVLSQPSSIDGNLWEGFKDFITFCESVKGLQVAVDLAYVGALTRPRPAIDLDRPCIQYVFISLSKVFGVYFNRIGGVFSRTEIRRLRFNNNFKNIDSLYIGEKLVDRFSLYELPMLSTGARDTAMMLLKSTHKCFESIMPSDCIMLINLTKAYGPFEDMVRYKERARVCLTPAISRLLQGDYTLWNDIEQLTE